jgi:hypothetical protein
VSLQASCERIGRCETVRADASTVEPICEVRGLSVVYIQSLSLFRLITRAGHSHFTFHTFVYLRARTVRQTGPCQRGDELVVAFAR